MLRYSPEQFIGGVTLESILYPVVVEDAQATALQGDQRPPQQIHSWPEDQQQDHEVTELLTIIAEIVARLIKAACQEQQANARGGQEEERCARHER